MTGGSGCYLFIFKHRNSRSCIKILSSSQNDVLTSAQGSSETRTWHTPALPYWVMCTWTDWPRALTLEILPGSHQASSPMKLETKLPSSSGPCCQMLTHLSAELAFVLRSDQVPDWQRQYSHHPRRQSLRRRVSEF